MGAWVRAAKAWSVSKTNLPLATFPVRAAAPLRSAPEARMARKVAVPPPLVSLSTAGDTLPRGSAEDEADPAEASTVAESMSRRTIRGRRFTMLAPSWTTAARWAVGLG